MKGVAAVLGLGTGRNEGKQQQTKGTHVRKPRYDRETEFMIGKLNSQPRIVSAIDEHRNFESPSTQTCAEPAGPHAGVVGKAEWG